MNSSLKIEKAAIYSYGIELQGAWHATSYFAVLSNATTMKLSSAWPSKYIRQQRPGKHQN